MSRSGYVDVGDCDEFDHLRASGWAANVRRCIAGRVGQAFMWELYLSLEALPTRELITGALVNANGTYCSLGAVAATRHIPIPDDLRETAQGEPDEYEFADEVASLLGIKNMLAQEVMFQNDENSAWYFEDTGQRVNWAIHYLPYNSPRKIRKNESPAERWQRMRAWVVSHLKGIP